MEVLRPAAEWELQSMIAKLAADKRSAEVVGNGGLRGIGRPAQTDAVISMASLREIGRASCRERV